MESLSHTTHWISRLEGWDEFVDKTMHEWDVPGAGLAVVTADHPILIRGYGIRDREQGLPVDAHTLFGLGSVSKAFTTTGLALLASRGKLDWNAPVRQYLPAFRLADSAISERVTVRDIVSHRSGLPRHDMLWYLSPDSRQDILAALAHLPLSQDLRAAFQYNNLLYMVAGAVTEAITGLSWEDFIQKEFLTPLHMDRTNFSVEISRLDENAALPYQAIEDVLTRVPYCNLDAVAPCGGINSTAADLAQWLQFHLSGGKSGNDTLIPPEFLQDTYSPATIISDADNSLAPFPETPGVTAYASGWTVRTFHNQRILSHTGSIDGFGSMLAILPKAGIGAAMVCNRDNSDYPFMAVLSLFERLLDLPLSDWNTRIHELELKKSANEKKERQVFYESRINDTRPAHPLVDYTGIYTHPAYGDFKITQLENILVLDYHAHTLKLQHFHFELFESYDPRNSFHIKLQFHTAMDGSVQSLSVNLEASLEPLTFTRKPSHSR